MNKISKIKQLLKEADKIAQSINWSAPYDEEGYLNDYDERFRMGLYYLKKSIPEAISDIDYFDMIRLARSRIK